MNTKTTEAGGASATAWWERLGDAGGDGGAGRGLLKLAIAAAAVVLVVVVGLNLFKQGKEEEANSRNAILTEAQSVMPRPGFDPFNPDPAAYAQLPGIMIMYRNSSGSESSGSPSAPMVDPETAAAELKKIVSQITTLEEKKGDFAGTEQEWAYWHTLQALHFYASRNEADDAKRIQHLESQLSVLGDIEKKFKDTTFFAMRPDTDQPEKNVIDLWRDLAQADVAFYKANPTKVEVKADSGLRAKITLGDGKVVELEFYSRTAPKSVAAFLANARAGLYDGTAVNHVDKEAGTITFGNPFTKVAADRPFIWDQTNKFYNVPLEMNLRLPVEEGSVALRQSGQVANGFEFDIFVKAPGEDAAPASVFAKVISGLEHLRPLLDSELRKEEKLLNKTLPLNRIDVGSVSVEGEIQYPSVDSWKPLATVPELPEVSEPEKAFEEAVKAAENAGDGEATPEGEKKEENDG
ncbi:MAG: peptidylprolyl isomerase [Planctomycetota bacterium]